MLDSEQIALNALIKEGRAQYHYWYPRYKKMKPLTKEQIRKFHSSTFTAQS